MRHGGAASVRKVVGMGLPTGDSSLPRGAPAALKLWNEGDERALEMMQSEARVLVELTEMGGEIPCPRLYDLIGEPLVTGLVMEWCPVNLERWWREKLTEPDAFGRLMTTLAEAARRVSDYHVFYASKRGLDGAHGDLKPSNILLSMDGRWVISDFGGAHSLLDELTWDESRVILATDNFLAPELVFNARRAKPSAMDTWSLATTAFALLRMRRIVLEGEPFPTVGTYSPRFRMERATEVIRIFNRDPTRFFDRNIEPSDFTDPLRIPDEDRRLVLDALRGVFGEEDAAREQKLGHELLELFDQATSIEPAHRFTDARGLAAAFERMTRLYLELLSRGPSTAAIRSADVDAVKELDAANREARDLSEEVMQMRSRLERAHAQIERGLDPRAVRKMIHNATWRPPMWWGLSLVLILLMQGLTMLLTVALAIFGR